MSFEYTGFTPRNRTEKPLPLLRIEIRHANGVLAYDPNSLITAAIRDPVSILGCKPLKDAVSVISGHPAVVYAADDVEAPMTTTEVLALVHLSLQPAEYFALRERFGIFHEIHDDFYDLETGLALQPNGHFPDLPPNDAGTALALPAPLPEASEHIVQEIVEAVRVAAWAADTSVSDMLDRLGGPAWVAETMRSFRDATAAAVRKPRPPEPHVPWGLKVALALQALPDDRRQDAGTLSTWLMKEVERRSLGADRFWSMGDAERMSEVLKQQFAGAIAASAPVRSQKAR